MSELERRLADMYASRDPGPAPQRLRSAVRLRLATERTSQARSAIRPMTLLAAAVLVTALAVAAIIAGQRPSTPTPTSNTAIASPSPTTSASPSATASPSPAPIATTAALPAFTTPLPPASGAAWTQIRWHKLPAGSALASVRAVVSWSGGYIALGDEIVSAGRARTPVWLSSDGASWFALDPTVLGPTTVVAGVAAVQGGLAMLTYGSDASGCTNDPTCWSPAAPIRSWTSSDGSTWTSHPGPTLPLPTSTLPGRGPLLAGGPAGLVAMGAGQGGLAAATSLDGVAWTALSAGAFPAGFQLGDLTADSTSYVVVGASQPDTASSSRGLVLRSTDGQHWSAIDLPNSTPASQPDEGARSLRRGSAGSIVVGGTHQVPGAEVWWQSSNGTTWRLLSGYPPLGPSPAVGEGGGLGPNGSLVADGDQLVAYRGGSKPAAWASFDGATWQPLAVSGGGLVDEQANGLVMVPNGLLITDSSGTSWFGEAVGQ